MRRNKPDYLRKLWTWAFNWKQKDKYVIHFKAVKKKANLSSICSHPRVGECGGRGQIASCYILHCLADPVDRQTSFNTHGHRHMPPILFSGRGKMSVGLIITLVMMWQNTVIAIPAAQDIEWCHIKFRIVPCPVSPTPIITSTTTTTTTTTTTE